jgi:hypothetical protein
MVTADSFPKKFYRVVLILYAPNRKRVLVTRKTMPQALNALALHPRRNEFLDGDERIQVDFIIKKPKPIEQPLNIEVGVDGLIITGGDGKDHIFMPADCFVRSIMSMNQLYEYLNRVHGEDYVRKASVKTFRTESFISKADGWLPLYRGYPIVGDLTKDKLETAVRLSIDHVKLTQYPNGEFLYYYDAVTDSILEPHRKRTAENSYYNILRHAGGGLFCLDYEAYTGYGDTKENIVRAIEYLIKSMVVEVVDGVEQAYVYSERKAKLGGAGTALYLLARYELFYGDSTYRVWAERLYQHLLGQITTSGEFIYYHIYLDNKITEENNQEYFSFYYPGEALCGIATYMKLLPEKKRKAGFEKVRSALHFLLQVRPITHTKHYASLPSDSWLMMAIEELWDFPEMRDFEYAQFVFDDARKMINHMYTAENALYPDYTGSFYYYYGEHPYPDGARLEGVIAAYKLAKKVGNMKLVEALWSAMEQGAWSVLHLVNTPDSTYSVSNPAITIGGVRLKLTRQWFRIDTIQHVSGFLAKMLPYWEDHQP